MGVLDPNDKILTTATARNKKVAEQEASRSALELLEPSLNEAFNVAKVVSPVLTSMKGSPKLLPIASVPVTTEGKGNVVRRRLKIDTLNL